MFENIHFINTTVKMPLMSLPVCTPIISIDNKKILISPGSQTTDSQYALIQHVTDILAPNLFHYAGVAKASAHFPNATLWKCPSLQKKAPGIYWQKELGVDEWPYQKDLPLILLKGMPAVNEVVFIHTQSQTLILSDFAFNMGQEPGIGAKIILNVFGTYNKFAISKLIMKTIRDKTALEKSLGEVFSYDFDNIIVGHGRPVIGNAKDLLLSALKKRDLIPK